MSITSLDGYLMLAKSFSVDSLFSVGLAKSRDSIYSFCNGAESNDVQYTRLY